MTWASLTAPFVGTVNIAGTDGDGKITGVGGAAVALLGWIEMNHGPKKWVPVLTLLPGLVIAGVGGWDANEIETAIDDSGGLALVRVGPGLWLTIVAGVAVVVASIAGIAKSR